jgi:hypothetical protein
MRKLIFFGAVVLLAWWFFFVFRMDEVVPEKPKENATVKTKSVEVWKEVVSPLPHAAVISTKKEVPKIETKKADNACTSYISDGTKKACLPERFSEISENQTTEEDTQELAEDMPFFDPIPPDTEATAPTKSLAPRGEVKFTTPELVQNDTDSDGLENPDISPQ